MQANIQVRGLFALEFDASLHFERCFLSVLKKKIAKKRSVEKQLDAFGVNRPNAISQANIVGRV